MIVGSLNPADLGKSRGGSRFTCDTSINDIILLIFIEIRYPDICTRICSHVNANFEILSLSNLDTLLLAYLADAVFSSQSMKES